MPFDRNSNTNYPTSSININNTDSIQHTNNKFYDHRWHDHSASQLPITTNTTTSSSSLLIPKTTSTLTTTTNTKPNQVITTTAKVIRQPQTTLSTLDSESQSRPLSLYDNLSALVAALKPPHLSATTGSDVVVAEKNTNQSQLSYDTNEYRRLSGNGDSNLINVKQEDFVFSDITFKFPELFGAVKSVNINNNNNNRKSLSDVISINNNNNEYLKNNLENFKNNQKSVDMNDTNIVTNSNNMKNPSSHHYVNIDDESIVGNNKSAMSDAKSSFFGLNDRDHCNNTNNRDLYQLNDSVTRPLLADQTLNDSNNTRVVASPSTASQASTSSASSDPLINNNNHNHHHLQNQQEQEIINVDINSEDDAENVRKSRNGGDTNTKTVSYITPEHNDLLNKPSQVSCIIFIFNLVSTLSLYVNLTCVNYLFLSFFFDIIYLISDVDMLSESYLSCTSQIIQKRKKISSVLF